MGWVQLNLQLTTLICTLVLGCVASGKHNVVIVDQDHDHSSDYNATKQIVTDGIVIYMEPPDCQHDITLQPGQVMYLESSHRNHTHNGEGECSVRITNSDTTKHLAYTFEIGPNITDCSVELEFTDHQIPDPKHTSPIFNCRRLHSYTEAHADNYTGSVIVKRPYVTLRKDFYFRIRVDQIEPWEEHVDNGLGYYVNRNQSDPAVAMVLYTILALDFIVPTLIFVINECSARLENKRRRAEEAAQQEYVQSGLNIEDPEPLDPQNVKVTEYGATASNLSATHKSPGAGSTHQMNELGSRMADTSPEMLLFPFVMQAESRDRPVLLKAGKSSRKGTLYSNSVQNRSRPNSTHSHKEWDNHTNQTAHQEDHKRSKPGNSALSDFLGLEEMLANKKTQSINPHSHRTHPVRFLDFKETEA